MRQSYFDVVILGSRFEGLLSAALLARRGFRVLVIGQGDQPSTYAIGDERFPRSHQAIVGIRSPAVRRVLAELALHQGFRRRAVALDPSFQVVLPGHRVDRASDTTSFAREIAREFPEVKRSVDDFERVSELVRHELDELVQRDLMWPPETFWERRDFSRATAHGRFDRHGEGLDPFAELPEGHPFRALLELPTRFASSMDPSQLPSLARFRLYDAWSHGVAHLEGGRAWLDEALIEKLGAHGGQVRERERADGILTRRGVAVGVRLRGSDEVIGAGHVVSAVGVGALLPLLPDRSAFGELFERLGEPRPRFYRYTLNVVVRAEAVPAGMARDVFLSRNLSPDAADEDRLHIELSPADGRGTRRFTVSSLVARRDVEDTERLHGLRERLLAGLREVVPFLDEHLVLIDSPHDGREVQDLREGSLRAPAEPWNRGPRAMEIVYGFPVRQTLGLTAMPVRTPIRNLLLANTQIVPGLGTEGAVLAAWSAARAIGRVDKRKEWRRRNLWSKVEV